MQDDESNLIYMRARYYEPSSGRFISEDPGRDGGNWLVYCKDNPVSLIDKEGRLSELAEFAIGLALMFIGWALLGQSPVIDPEWLPGAAVRAAVKELERIGLGSGDYANVLRGQLATRAKAARMNAGGSASMGAGLGFCLSALAGKAMIEQALILDIDLASSDGGYDILLTFTSVCM